MTEIEVSRIDALEGVFGKGSRAVIGKVVMMNYGLQDLGMMEAPKILFGGVFYGGGSELGELAEREEMECEMWTGGFMFRPKKGWAEKDFGGYRMDQILCDRFGDRDRWAEDLPVFNGNGFGKAIVMNKGSAKIADEELQRYMVSGVVFGNSLTDVTNQELWSGGLIIVPTEKYRGCERIKRMRIDQVLCSPYWHDPQYWNEKFFDVPENKEFVDSLLD
jgi:hypothetical protein